MNKTIKKLASLMLAIIVLATVINPTVTHAATKSPVTKVTTRDTRNGRTYGNKLILPFGGSFYYRTTVNFAKSSKKTSIRLKYSHQVTPTKAGAFKLVVGKKTIKLLAIESYPYRKRGYKSSLDTEIYLESVEIKTGKKWKKIKLANDQVRRGVFAKMNTYTLKKIPKGTKVRFTFHACVGVPRTSSAIR